MATELENLAKEMGDAGYCNYAACLEFLERARALGHKEAAKLADMDGCERVGAAIRALSKEG